MTVDIFERPDLFANLGGLCGDFDNNHTNEFYDPYGQLMTYEGDFGNSWMNEQITVSHIYVIIKLTIIIEA